MYEDFYGLTDEPFSITPNPKFLYLSKKHEGGLEHLLHGIERKRGLIVLTGDIGTGKTTLLNTIVQRVDKKTHVAFLVHAHISPLDIYRYIFHKFDLKIDVDGKTEGDLLLILENFLDTCANNGENCVLIIDEAQSLSQDVLEQIRLLLNFETHDRKFLQIILVGHPTLHETLNALESAKLRQRVSLSYNLLPLDYVETKGYIEKRLLVAGATRPIYTQDAIAEVYHFSKGIPRLINIVCELALFLGCAKEQVLLDQDVILEAKQMLQMKEAQVAPPFTLEPARERGGEAPGLHPKAVNEPTQGGLSPPAGRLSQEVFLPPPGLLDRADSRLFPQAPTSGRRFGWSVLGGVTAGLTLGLIFWGALLYEPASLQHGIDKQKQLVQQFFTASPSAQPSAVGPSTGTEPTRTGDALLPQRQGALASAPLVGMPGAASAPSEALASTIPLPTSRVIVVQAGDTLGAIVLRTYKRLDSRLLALVQEANPTLTNPERIAVGQHLVLPNLPQ